MAGLNVLSLNPGSSSLKYALLEMEGSSPTPRARKTIDLSGQDRGTALDRAIEEAKETGSIDAVACRVVHGGERFTRPTVVTPRVIEEVEKLRPIAPLHNAADVDAIRSAHRHFPDVPIVAVFDTAFHRDMPAVASTYGLPDEVAVAYGVRRFGFHGISYAHLVRSLPPFRRLIACHLGSGASVCAIRDGVSVDTSMGFTPLEGLVMGTRSGDLDPGIVFFLMREAGMSLDEVENLLNRKSGLLGLSGVTNDAARLSALASSGDPRADVALDIFAYRVAKYVGAYAVALGGVDGLAFTGGIGENSVDLRNRIVHRLKVLGLELDQARNIPLGEAPAAEIQAAGSIPIWAVRADEERQMAMEAYALIVPR